MESQGYLDPISERDLFALHFVFLPRIQRSLSIFQEGWNNHGIRTEHNKTPNQLFASGALQLRHAGLVALDFFEQVANDHGIDEDDRNAVQDAAEGTHVPEVSFQLTAAQLDTLKQSINPLEDCQNYGIDIYIQVIQLLQSF